MLHPEKCFSLLKRYEKASENYRKFSMKVLGTVECEGSRFPITAIEIGKGSKVLVATGIHGDEPAAPEALIRFIESKNAPSFLRGFHVTIFPILNPIGFAKNTRKNGKIDLNRHYGCRRLHKENRIVEEYVKSKKYDMMISLHEDVDMDSFYMYETGCFDAERFRDTITDDLRFLNLLRKRGFRINCDREIYGIINRGGIKIVPKDKGRNLERYLWSRGIVKRVVCIESPGKTEFEKRVEIQILALRHFLKSFIV
ncbi:MAG: M14 family metallocarboxypeptidase [Candidatus Aenigmarchaeota archaeon]|nr:M14 family metallocarboxypeptidase [Candidatus Aenigmarchaeota archaeon]MDI6722222.1 M14 family metallocarboxypeptidase [Candidatus Aenigmarchaeota archaeon]